jgi:hypothetical protein
VVIAFNNGMTMSMPVRLLQGLADDAVTELADVELPLGGQGLWRPKLDVDLSIAGLLARRYGSGTWKLAARASWRLGRNPAE